MDHISTLIISFLLVFISELGDKTQLLILSFSSKVKTLYILIGIAIGSFFSHGIAILFGSYLSLFENEIFHNILEIITYISFVFFGILSFIPEKKSPNSNEKASLMHKLSKLSIGYVLIIAFSIILGEIGDKTFLASIGLGISYPNFKFSLVLGAILGMVSSDLIAIISGKVLHNKLSENSMKKLSGILFIIFGIFGFLKSFLL